MQYTFLSRLSLRCARYLIERYPVSWRERYSEEMLLLLEDCPPTFTTVINLIFHLFDAYAHPHLLNGGNPPMLQRMRSSELSIYCAAVIFLLALFWSIVAASTLIGYSRDLLSAFFPLFITSRYVFLLLLPLLLLGGLPILLATSWKILKARKYHVLLFLCLSLMSPLITIFLAAFFEIDIAWVLFLCIMSPAMNLALICMAIQNVTPSRRITHSVLYLATLLPLVMLVGCAIVLFCVLSAFTTGSTASYMMNEGFFFWFSSLCLMLLIMIATCSLSLFSLLKGFQAKWATQKTL